MTDAPVTLIRPDETYIRAFKPRMIEDDTIGNLLDKGWSLGICCRNCPRVVEWTPPELARRFGDKRGVKLADLAPRLSCTGPAGCGGHDVVIFPYCEHPDDRQKRETARLV